MRLVATESLRLHPEAGRVPLMPPDQFAEFLADLRERGVLVPLEILADQTILDGRTRWLAARELGLRQVPVVAAPVGDGHPVLYMLRAASKRRHLTDDQRACLAEEEMEFLAAENRSERARAGGLAGGRGRVKTDSSAITAVGESAARDRRRDSRFVVAAQYGISQRRVQSARRLKEDSPALYGQVKAGELRLAEALREVQRAEKRRQQRQLAQHAAQSRASNRPWSILVGDCLQELPRLEPGTARLIFADPPYNIGIDYGQGSAADQLPEARYLAWCRQWIDACVRLLTDDGSLWVMINDEYADHYGLLLRQAGLHRRAWIKWYETFGVNCTKNFNRCSRHIFYCVKHPQRFVFHTDAVSRPSDRQLKYADARAAPHGKLWDNVWTIPRLVENSRERLPDVPTQLPLDLVRPIVLCASDPGDLVLDPFSGSGTTGVAAVEGQRRFVGTEISPQFGRLSELRIAAASGGTGRHGSNTE